jgi:hypothetical protein
MGGAVTNSALSATTGQQAQVGSMGNTVGMGGGGGAAAYDPNSTAPSILGGGGTPAPGQMNWQVSDAQKANLLAQQQQQPQQAIQQPQQAVQQAYRPQMQPQQMMRQNSYPQTQYGGLQQLLNRMLGGYQQQQQQQRFYQMPQYQNRALGYRPNMANTQQNLSRVAPSVELQQKRAAEEEARRQAENPVSYALQNIFDNSSPAG